MVFTFSINFNTATRTPIVLFFIIYLTLGLIYVYNKERKIGRAFWIIVIVATALVVLYELNIFGIKTYILSTPLFDRIQEEGMKTSRWDITVLYLKNTFKYLWGNNHVATLTGHQAHNYLQQAHDLYGIFATIPVLILSFSFIKNIVKLLSIQKKQGIDFLLLGMYLCMIIQMCMEPVFTGYPIIIWALLLIHGMTNEYLEAQNKGLYENRSN